MNAKQPPVLVNRCVIIYEARMPVLADEALGRLVEQPGTENAKVSIEKY